MVRELIEYLVGGALLFYGFYLHWYVIRPLKEEKRKLQSEIDALTDDKNAKSRELVEQLLHVSSTPICRICKELLLLFFSTNFENAINRLKAIPTAVEQSARPVDMVLVLDALEKAVRLDLWPGGLRNSDTSKKRCEDVIREAVSAYLGLIPHMGRDSKERAIEFCIEENSIGSPYLKREIALRLLPHLLVMSMADGRLVKLYKDLLGVELTSATEEQKRLLIAVFGGIKVAARVDSHNVSEIWALAFGLAVAKENLEWAWDPHGSNIGIEWLIAIESRLAHSDPQEWQFLKHLIGHHLESPSAPSHDLSYMLINRTHDVVRRKIDPTTPPFREPNRAIVPDGTRIGVQITMNEPASVPMDATLVNFSLNYAEGKIQGGGAWATGEDNPQWVPNIKWRNAKVVVVQDGDVLFDQAKVQGPIREGKGDRSYYGFRIRLGPGAPEEGLRRLKRRWDTWHKR